MQPKEGHVTEVSCVCRKGGNLVCLHKTGVNLVLIRRQVAAQYS